MRPENKRAAREESARPPLEEKEAPAPGEVVAVFQRRYDHAEDARIFTVFEVEERKRGD